MYANGVRLYLSYVQVAEDNVHMTWQKKETKLHFVLMMISQAFSCTLNYAFPRLFRVNDDDFTSTTTGMGLLCSLRRLLEARSWLVFEVVELPPADLVGLVFRIELCQLRLGLRWQPCPQLRRDRGIASRMARGPGNLQGTGSLCFLFLFFDLDLKHWTWHRFELNAQLVDGVK